MTDIEADFLRRKLELDIVRGRLNLYMKETNQDIKIIERVMGLMDEGIDIEVKDHILSEEVTKIIEKVFPPESFEKKFYKELQNNKS